MAWQQACTDEDLEAVADAQDRAVSRSQLMPGARRTRARGVLMPLLLSRRGYLHQGERAGGHKGPPLREARAGDHKGPPHPSPPPSPLREARELSRPVAGLLR